MARWLAGIILLGALAAVAACIEVAPHSSVPFHAARDRQVRYAAEVTLAIKEERRDEVSEAAANGRVVVPQMPEIWGLPRSRVADGPAVASVRPIEAPPDRWRPPLPSAAPPSCRPGECELQIAGLMPAPLPGAAIAPAAAPRGADPDAHRTPYSFQIYFDRDSAAIDAAAQRVVAGAVGRALMLRPARITVAGHADRAGIATYNEALAQRRAAAVVGALVRAGVPPELIEATALGERAPAVRTFDGVAHRHNRRVEITLG